MKLSKCKKFLKDDNYVHCSICGNYGNINSFSHRKSKHHQKRLAFKLRKIAFHLSQKKKIQVVIHDEQWQDREIKRFCHFCAQSYAEHYMEDEFIVEHLGSLYHHADSHHAESVEAFLKRNFYEGKIEKYCIQKSVLDSFLGKLPEAKTKYLKKMDMLNDIVVKQIKASEENRKKLLADALQVQSSFTFEGQSLIQGTSSKGSTLKSQSMLNSKKTNDDIKVPPWLDDVSDNSAIKKSAPVIGPTMDTLKKHVISENKKRFPKNRVGANFKHDIQGSNKWLPSFQGTWNKGRRKQTQTQFNWRKKKEGF